MFTKDNMKFHNVSQFDYNEEIKGNHLIRVPEKVIEQLTNNPKAGNRGRFNYKTPVGSEIRFVMECEKVVLNIYMADDVDEQVTIMFGDFIGEYFELKQGYNTIEIEMPSIFDCFDYSEKQGRFTPNVVRVVFFGLGRKDIYYVSKEGETRLPTKDELPEKTLLCYGTSITHGANCNSQALTYTALTAKKLGMDMKNLGTSGSAYCEEAIAKFIANDIDWDYATFCVSVNMVNQSYELELYYERIKNFVNIIHSANPTKHIFCISPFRFFRDFPIFPVRGLKQYTVEQYRDAVKQVVEEVNSPYVHYVHGKDMLTDITGLRTDILHPNNLGMIEISENLSKEIQKVIDKQI